MSGLRPFQFDDATPMHAYQSKPSRSFSIRRVLGIALIIVVVLVFVAFFYYRAKADTFDNSVRSDVQLASQTVSQFLTTHTDLVTFNAQTPGLTLKTTNGNHLVITGLGNSGDGLPTGYEIHGWNPKSQTYPSVKKYWEFVSTSGAYEAVNG